MSVFIGEKNKRVELAERKDAINPNLLLNSKGPFQPQKSIIDNWQIYPDSAAYLENGQTYTISGQTNGTWSGTHNNTVESDKCVLWFCNSVSNHSIGTINTIVSSDKQVNNSNQFVWTNPTGTYQLRVNGYKPDNSTKAWNIKVEHGAVATDWCPAYDDYASNSGFNTLQNNVYTKPEVDSKTSGTVVTAYDVASKTPTKVTDSYTDKWLVDQGVLGQFADQINQLKGRQTADAPDFNTLTDSGVYYISNPSKGKNFPSTSWGTLAVFNGNSQRIMQIFSADDGTSTFARLYGVLDEQTSAQNAWGSWNQIAWKSDITNLQNTVNNINSTRTPIVNGASGDDLFSFKTNQIRLYTNTVSTCKNLPPASNTNFFTVQYIFEEPNDNNANGMVIYRTPDNEIWTAACNGGNYDHDWTRVANATDITNLQNTINQQSQTIQSLTTRLTNAESEISYIKANYIEGKQFPASQEAQATAWENANPQGIAFITSN